MSLNPAQLKREIDDKLNKLFKDYQQKNKSQSIALKKKLKPNYSDIFNCTTTYCFGYIVKLLDT